MNIEHCYFPDNLLYDSENNTWVNIAKNQATIGITSLLGSLLGRLTSFRPKMIGSTINRGSSLGTLEGPRFVGPVPSPLTGEILEINSRVVANPKILNDSPYTEGWIVKLRTLKLDEEALRLSGLEDVRGTFKREIESQRIRCFQLFPDQEMYEIGVECFAVLAKLGEAFASLPIGGVVHLVSDDNTALVEMTRWTDLNRHSLVEWRAEGNLTHFIVRKDHD